MVAKKKRFNPEDLLEQVLDGEMSINDALAEIERRMAPYEKLNEVKHKLLAGRRALLGTGSRLTGSNARLTLDDLIAYMRENPGKTPGELAQHFGVTQTTISSHFYRNKTRFINKDGGYWVRDPKSGLDTADDIEEDEDE